MKQTTYQFTDFTPEEFEQFRARMAINLMKIADKIDFVGSAALTIGGSYNRNHQVLNVMVSASEAFVPTQETFDDQVFNLTGRDSVTSAPVQTVPVKTPIDKHGMLINQSGTSSRVPAPPHNTLAGNLKAAFAIHQTPNSPSFVTNFKSAVTSGPVSTEPPKKLEESDKVEPPIKQIVPQATAAKKA